MDLASEELGGERSFFKGEFEKYAWRRIFDPRMGGFEILNLYSEAIMKMNVNPNIPQLFRDIFKNAYLPYRDPETLKAFLKIINEFTYDHSERLGDSFEYLLSVLGSQGEAGQFRTPRHIIDFMVAIIDPKKDEVILDPACGTAGFLISSYKHILKNNSTNYDPKTDIRAFETKNQSLPELIINSKNYKGDKLTPDERSRLAKNIKGYDISPDMVRLSLVNMYLHGLHAPQISEYDTLTSEDNWNEYGDVILANPPFMSPKGGIRPHKRFSISSNRSEVLFVDYIAEHLTPNGRAAVIVPEGIIFQSGNAYKNLRKMLVEKYLVGVISLPAGVFQPYSGVKTSILWLDRTLAKKTDKILFVKIENDGFDLGAQRRPIKQNNLPDAINEIIKFKDSIMQSSLFSEEALQYSILVAKGKIQESSDISFNGGRYQQQIISLSDYAVIHLVNAAEIIAGQSPSGQYYNEDGNGLPFYQGKTEFCDIYLGSPTKWTSQITKEAYKGDILMSVRAPVGPVNIATQHICIGRGLAAIRAKTNAVPIYLFYLLRSIQDKLVGTGGSVFDNISKKQIEEIQIPLPPLSIQEEIVAEIESYQKIIDGARQVVENFKPRIDIDPEWEEHPLSEFVIQTQLGLVKGKAEQSPDFVFPYIKMNNITINGKLDLNDIVFVNATNQELKNLTLNDGDFIYNTRNSPELVGKSAVYHGDNGKYLFNNNILKIRFNENLNPDYTNWILNLPSGKSKIHQIVDGTTSVAAIYQKNFLSISIPIPSRQIQDNLVKKINEELSLVDNNRKLITLFEQRIKDRIAKVWGE